MERIKGEHYSPSAIVQSHDAAGRVRWNCPQQRLERHRVDDSGASHCQHASQHSHHRHAVMLLP
ncbi:MAG: hypothetical protein ACK5ZV_04690 [bacterium]